MTYLFTYAENYNTRTQHMWIPPLNNDQEWRVIRTPMPKNTIFFDRLGALYFDDQEIIWDQIPL